MSETTNDSNPGFVLPNGAYNFLKNVALLWLPAFGVLYFALAPLWELPKADEVVGTVVALEAFLGTILGVSGHQYKKTGKGTDDGELVINEQDPEKDIYSFEPYGPLAKLGDQEQIVLKVRRES